MSWWKTLLKGAAGTGAMFVPGGQGIGMGLLGSAGGDLLKKAGVPGGQMVGNLAGGALGVRSMMGGGGGAGAGGWGSSADYDPTGGGRGGGGGIGGLLGKFGGFLKKNPGMALGAGSALVGGLANSRNRGLETQMMQQQLRRGGLEEDAMRNALARQASLDPLARQGMDSVQNIMQGKAGPRALWSRFRAGSA